MKFLTKNIQSSILSQGLVYLHNAAANNVLLKEKLFAEQKGFCAYTERFVEIKECEVEHFNNTLKYKDNYYNYYAVLREANLRKRAKESEIDANAISLFFQNADNFNKRIKYNKKNHEYEVTNIDDNEADTLIEFLGFNDFELKSRRSNHLNRLKKNKKDSQYSDSEFIDYLKEFKQDNLSFVTAIEVEFGIDLSIVINEL